MHSIVLRYGFSFTVTDEGHNLRYSYSYEISFFSKKQANTKFMFENDVTYRYGLEKHNSQTIFYFFCSLFKSFCCSYFYDKHSINSSNNYYESKNYFFISKLCYFFYFIGNRTAYYFVWPGSGFLLQIC